MSSPAADLDKLMNDVAAAQEKMCRLTQVEVDRMFHACALAANKARVRLAEMTVKESGMGVLEDKVIKNHFASEVVYNCYKNTKTCGVIEDDHIAGFSRYAEPVGLLAAAIPCTNPTSTAIFKCLLALKTRNTIVISPHPRTAKCTIEAAKIIRDAACALGAPANWVGWIEHPTPDLCGQMMKHEKVSMIVATGAGGLVKAAYSSGKPAMGGGSGNTPVVIDETADIPMAVNSVLLSKTFDNGMICASEQSVIVVAAVAEEVKAEFLRRGAYFLNPEEKKAVGDLILSDNGALNPPAVGQSAMRLAEMANVKGSPAGVRLLMAELSCIGPEEKLSHEKLCPCVGFIRVKDFDEALDKAHQLVHYGGMGHTSVLYTDLSGPHRNERISRFQERMPTGRTLVCCPTSQGAIGGLFNFRQHPSLTLCCGSWGSNATAESLQVKHLLNVKEVCQRRVAPVCFLPPRYHGDLKTEISKLDQFVVVADVAGADLVATVSSIKGPKAVEFVQAPDVSTIKRVAAAIGGCDVVAVGAAVAISVAKLARIVDAYPNFDLFAADIRFFSAVGKLNKLPCVNHQLVCVPVASKGNEQMDDAFILDNGKFTYLHDSCLRTTVNVNDPMVISCTSDASLRVAAYSALVSGFESYMALGATEAMREHAATHCRTLWEVAVSNFIPDKVAAVRAISDLGAICNSTGPGFALTIASIMHVKMGMRFMDAFAACCRQVILFLVEPAPAKMGTYSGYSQPIGWPLMTAFAKSVGLSTVEDIVTALGKCAESVSLSIKVDSEAFTPKIDEMAMEIFDSQAALCAPRYPMVRELKALLNDVLHGRVRRIDLAAAL